MCLVLAAARPSAATAATIGVLHFDPHHTVVAFHLSGTLHETHGTFPLTEGTLAVDPASGAATGRVVVDATGGESSNDMRDARMSSVVLQSARFPTIEFRPARVDGHRRADGSFHATLHGELTLHGAAHALDVDVEGRLVGDQLTATARFVVPYVAWGLEDPSVLLLTVAKEVEIDVTTTGNLTWTNDEEKR